MPAVEPEPHGCERKAALLQNIQKAMADLMKIHEREMDALMAEDFELLENHRKTLHAARQYKASLIDLFREHVESHRC